MADRGTRDCREVLASVAEEYVCRPDAAKRLDLIRLRLDWLVPADRVLLEMYVNQNVSYTQLAQLNGRDVNWVRRRVQKLGDRLLADDYGRIQRKRDLFTPMELRVAYDKYLLGLGYRQIAERRRLGPTVARRISRQLSDWVADDRRRDERAGREQSGGGAEFLAKHCG